MGDLSVVEEICLSGISLGAKSRGGSYFPCMLPDVVPMIRPKCKVPFLGHYIMKISDYIILCANFKSAQRVSTSFKTFNPSWTSL